MGWQQHRKRAAHSRKLNKKKSVQMTFEQIAALNLNSASISLEEHSFKDDPYFSGDELGFDFGDDFSVRSDVIFSVVSSTTSVSTVRDETEDKIIVAKAEIRKRGSKFMRKKAAPYPVKGSLQPIATSTGVRKSQPNMSRRTRDAMLYIFPSFDRCDSLLFFPSTLARLTNCGDLSAIVKLLVTHCDKHCTMFGKDSSEKGFNIPTFKMKMEVLEQLQPDRITCFHHTQVDGNVIKAVGCMKFTKCREVYNGISRLFEHKPESKCFKLPWKEHILQQLELCESPADDKERYLALIESDCDIVIYSRMDMQLTIDDRTKKVILFHLKMTLTSIEEATRKDRTL